MTNNPHRFNIVVANWNRIEVFWESFGKVKNFDLKKDRLIIMDCSDNSNDEHRKSAKYIKKYGFQEGINYLFIVRRNWNLNHGAQLDYIRAVFDGLIFKPELVFFMQDHYLNTNRFIKEDTIPQKELIDLDEVAMDFSKEKKMVWFCSRKGFRISVRFTKLLEYYKKEKLRSHSKNIEPISLVVDGGNFCIRPECLIHDYKENGGIYTRGNGDGPFCHVWETRLSKIFYDKKITFFEKHRNLGFKTIDELIRYYPNPGKIWHYFYNIPVAFFLYGQDIYHSNFNVVFLKSIITEYLRNLKYDRNTSLKILNA